MSEINYVKLTIEEYNKLVKQQTLLEAAIQLKSPSWTSDKVLLVVDPAVIEDIVIEKFHQSEFTGNYRLLPTNEWWTIDAKIAELIQLDDNLPKEDDNTDVNE